MTSQLQYDLPPERIAQTPAVRRDASRLLVLDRRTGGRRHERFDRLVSLLPDRCLLVLNDTQVLPARLRLRRRTGGRIEGLFLRESVPGVWEVMLTGARRLKVGEELVIEGSGRRLRMLGRVESGIWRVEPIPGGDAHDILAECGRTPLPPYIRRPEHPAAREAARDARRYQTLYARRPGAVAAPTAGLHFTPGMFRRLAAVGIETVRVTLHVGVGTFTPIRCEDLTDHEMHGEWYECSPEAAGAINAAREAGRPIVAVGTTSVRVLESCADGVGRIESGSGWTRLFIYPPYRFRVIDGLLTNFHLPGSTLLAMVFAFAGRERILAAYNDAVERKYRFYSFGDAMLIV